MYSPVQLDSFAILHTNIWFDIYFVSSLARNLSDRCKGTTRPKRRAVNRTPSRHTRRYVNELDCLLG
jgi:hypothetical protein